jgi:hypothetical protein
MYKTLDYLPDLALSDMQSAITLTLKPYTPMTSGINWDNNATYSTNASHALLNSTFKWNGTEGATYDIFSTSYFDPFLIEIYDSLGNVIAVDDDSYFGTYGTDYVWDFVAPYTGTYFVTAGWDQGNYSKYVSLSIYEDIDTAASKTSIKATSDDYSKTTLTTGSVAVGGQTNGNIELAADEDWFKVTLKAGTTYIFDLRGADGEGGTLGLGSSEARLMLYDTNGYFEQSTINGGTGGDPLMSFVPTISGQYYIGVEELYDTGTGSYTLRVSESSIADDYPNTALTNGILAVGGMATGNIELPADQDWFKVTLQADTTYVFDLRGIDGGGGTLGAGSTEARLMLYDTNGYFEQSAINGGTGGDPLMSFVPTISGQYYIGVEELYDTGTGTYTIQMTTPYSATTTTATLGNDHFTTITGNDNFNGLSGIDTVQYHGDRNSYTLTPSIIGYTIKDNNGADGTDTLINIERLKFSNYNVALDITNQGAFAGDVAKILGAVFGVSAVANREYVGIGLYYRDHGMSYESLGSLAINATGKTAYGDVVELLWNNVVGSPISAADKSYYVGLLQGGMSVGALTTLAADTGLNLVNVDLIGLVSSGLAYTEFTI